MRVFFVDDDMARIGAAGGALVEEGKARSVRQNGEGGNRAAVLILELFQLVDGVEVFLIGREGQIGGIIDARGDEALFETAGFQIERIGVNALALAFENLAGAETDGLGVGADKNAESLFHGVILRS